MKPTISSKLPDSPVSHYLEQVDLPKCSHKKLMTECMFQISPKCRKIWAAEYREVYRTMERNEGKMICLYCSRAKKFSGRNNPNCQYKNVKDDVFKDICTEDQAYLLGWIASDGTVSVNNEINIAINQKDEYILHVLNDIVADGELPIKDKDIDLKYISICSKEITDDVCELLKIDKGNKSKIVGFPDLKNDELKWAFLRGLFDGDGTITDCRISNNPKCKIASSSDNMKNGISTFYDVPCYKNNEGIEWWSLNTIDFLGRLYDKCSPELCLSRKRLLYFDWCSWVPALMEKDTFGKLPLFKWYKTSQDAVAPYKKRSSDSGWDLTLVRKIRENGPMSLYGTGIKVAPDYGWYFDLVPRSNIIDSGYILANSVGVIDRSYRGEIMVGLIKIDPTKPDLELPSRIVQIIPRPIIHAEFIEVDTLDITDRNKGGFGSTGV
jgi:deoxyuridine 5'-triphosphate nucleotidohydrolase